MVRIRVEDEVLAKKRYEKSALQRSRTVYAKEQILNNMQKKEEVGPYSWSKKEKGEEGPGRSGKRSRGGRG